MPLPAFSYFAPVVTPPRGPASPFPRPPRPSTPAPSAPPSRPSGPSRPSRPWIPPPLLLIAAAVSAAALLTACDGRPGAMPQGPGAMKVQVFRVEPGTRDRTVELVGRVVAREPVLIHARHEGLRVEHVFVEAGQAVTVGQPLVRLDARALRGERQQAEQQRLRAVAQVAVARAQQMQAESRWRGAEDEARRFAAVAGGGAVSEIEHRQRRTQLEQAMAERDATAQALAAAQADLAAARAALQLADERERDGVLRATVAGIVSERRVEVGTVTDAAAGPLFKLARRGDREFEAWVDGSRLAGLRVGDAVDVTLTPTGSVVPLTVRGKVRAIDEALADDSRRGRVRVALPDAWPPDAPPPALGTTATATVRGAPVAGWPVPATALQFDPEPWVYVVEAGHRVAKRRVALSEDGAVVLGGLAAGDTVVRAAAALLSPGQVIEPVRPPAVSRIRLEAPRT
ncbi:hypothetical protein CDN99_07190 [Roseateles aquatilis]|uniref:Uncharacterized protein n=1 Tax=Roseateles aquatilis TaxID=431061 RepID=A0A246JHX6_9BURK|nr:efflux RND transporter periplasmic adaptor subunit [Roseateles aquatilis]OWQ92130.1 hypothetical protein CDN99_07190 [Roseateles aquatilis]